MLESLFTALGYGLCHQLPERSFFAGGFQLPVCARDTGIYLGFVAGLAVLWTLSRHRRPTDLPRWPVLAVIGVFILSMALDGITSYAGLRTTTNDLRLLTGLVTGWGLATLTLPMVHSQLWVRADIGRVPDGIGQSGVWLIALAGTFGVAKWVLPLLGVAYPLLVSVAIIVTFVVVNLVFVGLMPVFERRANRVRDLGPQLLVALLLGAAELAGASLLRVIAERLA